MAVSSFVAVRNVQRFTRRNSTQFVQDALRKNCHLGSVPFDRVIEDTRGVWNSSVASQIIP